MACTADPQTRGIARRRCPPPLLMDLGEMGAQRQGLTQHPSVPVHRRGSAKKRLRTCPETCLVSRGCLQSLEVGGNAFLCQRPVSKSICIQFAIITVSVQVLWLHLLLQGWECQHVKGCHKGLIFSFNRRSKHACSCQWQLAGRLACRAAIYFCCILLCPTGCHVQDCLRSGAGKIQCLWLRLRHAPVHTH